jgi:hypothetical protein
MFRDPSSILSKALPRLRVLVVMEHHSELEGSAAGHMQAIFDALERKLNRSMREYLEPTIWRCQTYFSCRFKRFRCLGQETWLAALLGQLLARPHMVLPPISRLHDQPADQFSEQPLSEEYDSSDDQQNAERKQGPIADVLPPKDLF